MVEKIALDIRSSKGRKYLDYFRIVFVERMADMHRVVTMQNITHNAEERSVFVLCPMSFAIHGLAISVLICGSSRWLMLPKHSWLKYVRLPLGSVALEILALPRAAGRVPLDTAKYAI